MAGQPLAGCGQDTPGKGSVPRAAVQPGGNSLNGNGYLPLPCTGNVCAAPSSVLCLVHGMGATTA